MTNRIVHKVLYKRLGNIKSREEWLKVAEAAGLRICRGSKHPYTIRDPAMPDDETKASLIAVIPNNLHKVMNQEIFKHILEFGVKEEVIWKALDMLPGGRVKIVP
jgi:hypothetical protein